jgi:sugar transferase EpsL
MRSDRAKRTIDVVVAAIGLALFALPMGTLAVVVLLRMGRPVLFVQERPGLHGGMFQLYKFRTMRNDRDEQGELLPDEQRITTLGRALRAMSLDELPELWNVLRGDMSLVGPRPLLPEYLDLYSPEQARRHEVRPGLTGLAQVEGRNALSWERKFELDVWYVDNWDLSLDLRILARTVWAVVLRRGISQDRRVGAERFRGPEPPIH